MNELMYGAVKNGEAGSVIDAKRENFDGSARFTDKQARKEEAGIFAAIRGYTIEPHAGGQVFLSQPQQQWRFTDESELMATALFAGHKIEAITDDAGAFDLMYLGFQAKGFRTMKEAQEASTSFAQEVLRHMGITIANQALRTATLG